MKNTDGFTFPEHDIIGEETLEAISQANKFNKWMYDTIRPHLRGSVLEIGSGIGNISKFLVQDSTEFSKITLSDIRPRYVEDLKSKFVNQEVVNMDLTDPEFTSKHKELLNSFDSIFLLNVLEHIEDDELAIKNLNKLLTDKGDVTILVPAYQTLYNTFDKNLEHFRRYTKSSLNKVVSSHLEVKHSQYFNLVGIAGWFIFGKVIGKQSIPSGEMKLYNALVPIFKIVDKVVMNKIGLSVISVGQKKMQA